MYDLVVVGARVAGSPIAMLAARSGLKVLLVDRKTFPSDTLSTCYIHQPGCARLARWGLLDRLIASGCPPIRSTRLQVHDIVIEGGVTGYLGQIDAYAPRRTVLDKILLEAARGSGAEVREGCAVVGVVTERGRVVGVELQDAGRTLGEVRARLIVGADGMRSCIARGVGAAIAIEHARLTCAYYTFWEGLEAGYELYEGDGAWVGAVPTHGAVLVATYFPQDRFEQIRTRAMAAHLAAVEVTAPSLHARMRAAQRVDRLWGTGDQQNFFRTAAGPGWALVGDAGHHKDSITARGITDAFVQAELLVGRIANHLGSPEQLDAALARYASDRDALMMPGYRATLAVANLDAQAQLQRMAVLRAVASDPRLAQLYFDVVAGIRPPGDLESVLRGPSIMSTTLDTTRNAICR